MMRQLVRACAVSTIFAFATATSSAETPAQVTPLEAAVEAFNVEAKKDPVGKSQPALTVDEVKAAVLMWDRRFQPIDSALFNRFRQIAIKSEFPPQFEIKSINGFHRGPGEDYEVWWVDLVFTQGNRGYSYRLRDVKIRVMTPSENQDVLIIYD